MNHKELIREILLKNIESRDCDVTLYIEVLKHFNCHNLNAILLLYKIKYKTIPSFDTISRLRRQAQEQEQSLRGEMWNTRHTTKQEKAKSDLGY